jgi:hypothetical protein
MLTSGPIQKIAFAPTVVCTWIGPSPSNAGLFYVAYRDADSDLVLGGKRNVVNLLAKAKAAGLPVQVEHGTSEAEITSVKLPGANISPVGLAVRDDAYSVTGANFPADVKVFFESQTAMIQVTPNLVRPHWVLISRLPTAIPTGRNMLHLEGTGLVSDTVPVEVSAGPAQPVRVLYTGQPKDRPYTIAFVANPAILTEGGMSVADSVLTQRQTYLDVVGYCLTNLLTRTESLLRQGDWDSQMRFVSIFDATATVTDATTLAHEITPNIMETRRDKLKAFVARYSEVADVVFVMTGSTTHDRASAWFTTDEAAGTTAYTYDGTNRVHGHFPSIPGSAALPLNMNQSGLTPLHEFGHAGSDFSNGKVVDLYVDGLPPGFLVNKKSRALATDAIPTNFGSYDGTTFTSDQNRDGLGYPSTWMSYHPVLNDAAHPNLMDNYWLSPGPIANQQVCRLDQLTSAWYVDRLAAKLGR